jgi:tetratricopeptide (TPR) repeat protein
LELGPKLAEHAELFAGVLDLESGSDRAVQPALERRLVEALRALLPSLRARLVVLAIDDFQWADDLTHRVLGGLFRECSSGLMVILAKRELGIDDGVLSATQHIELSPLSLDECARVIRSLAPGALDVGFAASMAQRTGGNPLFLEELCRSLPSTRAKEAYAGEERSVPSTVHGVIQARLLRLPARELHSVRVAAVIGNEFAAPLLAEVAADSDIEPLLQRLCAANIIRQGDAEGTYRFKHGITREVVYESVRLNERRALHRAVAEKLQQRAAEGGVQAQNEALAHHFVGSGDHALAAHHAELAGDRAAAAAALDRARAQYGTALSELDALEQTPELSRRWLAVSLKWARASVYCQAPDQLKVLERAARHAEELGDVNARADVAQMSAWICYALGEQQAAIDHCQRGLALAEQIGNLKQVGQLTSNLGQSYAAAGQYTQALPLLERAVALKLSGVRKGESSVPVGFAFAVSVEAAIYADQGDFAHAEQLKARALDAVRGRGHPIEASMLAICAMCELWRGDLDACIETCQRATEAAERVWGPYVFCISETMSAYSHFVQTRDPQQYDRLCRAVDWLETRSMGLYISMAYGCAAEASMLAGQPERARAAAERALGRAAHSDPFGEVVAYRVFAELKAAESGKYDEQVETWLKWADGAARSRGTARELALNKLCHARILERLGDRLAAQPLFVEARAELHAMSIVLHD